MILLAQVIGAKTNIINLCIEVGYSTSIFLNFKPLFLVKQTYYSLNRMK